MISNFTVVTWKEDDAWVSECLNNHVSSFGGTREESERNIQEALDLFYEGEKNIQAPKIDQASVSVKQLGNA